MVNRRGLQDTGHVPFWSQQMTRHLDDLRTGSYEGAKTREEREAVFKAAAELVSATVTDALGEVNSWLLDGQGTVTFTDVVSDGADGVAAVWELRWPDQEDTSGRLRPGPVAPVEVTAIFPAGWTHGHLRGRRLGNWPLQVTSAADAASLRPIIDAIIAAELHEVVYESAITWRVASGYTRVAAHLGERRLADQNGRAG
jgi:hypothetical protein